MCKEIVMEEILDIDEIREIEKNILFFLKDFCQEKNISFFLANGTLLGAVKYKGFIPWDDDIDVFVPREDYDRFMKEFKDTEQYKLFSIERVQNYYFPFAKLCDMTTRKEEINIENNIKLGLDVDIFPLDFFPSSLDKAKSQVRKINGIQRKLNFAKLEYNSGRSFIRTVCKLICTFYHHLAGANHYTNLIIETVKRGSDSELVKYLGCAVWPIYGVDEIIPATVFEDAIEIEFEGNKFSAPIGYDIYLRSLYGDYEKDPPIEKQCTHHSFKAYKLFN